MSSLCRVRGKSRDVQDISLLQRAQGSVPFTFWKPGMKRLLITGASGFVGGHVMRAAADRWETHGTYQARLFEHAGVRSHRLDLTDPSSAARLIERIRPAAVIHAAAWGNLEQCERDPESARRINTEATGRIAAACAALRCRLVAVSTDMVFDGLQGHYRETDKTNPINAYGKSKLSGEAEALNGCTNTVVGRSALIYGRPVTGSNSFSEKILERVLEGRHYNLYTDQYRSPVLVDDLAAALLELATNRFRGIIHLSGPDRIDRFGFGKILSSVVGFDPSLLLPVSMDVVRTEAPRPRDASLENALAKRILSTSLCGVREGLKHAYGK